MFETFRDKSRDDLFDILTTLSKALDIEVRMSDRGREEEKIFTRTIARNIGTRSLGIIDISNNRIGWINVVRIKNRDRYGPPLYRTVFGLPDPTPPPDHNGIDVKTIRQKMFPVFGKIVDVYWKGNDQRSGLIQILSDDPTIKNLSRDLGNIRVRSHSNKFNGWTLEIDKKIRLTKDRWYGIQKLVDHIFSTPRDL